MIKLSLGETPIDIAEGQTVLDALLAAGVDAPYSCRSGVCQTCLHRAVEGPIPEEAQAGLSSDQKKQGFFMPCVCVPIGPMTIVGAGDAYGKREVSVAAIDWLSDSVIRLRLEPERAFSYRPGQFIALTAPKGITRNYSIASHPEAEEFIELHMRIIPGGKMSAIVANELRPGDRLQVSEPSGACHYDGADPDCPIVLAGAGTGLAPLWGIVRDAIARQHAGPITLYHGARERSGLYLVEELQKLAERHDNFFYRPCVLSDAASSGDLASAVLGAHSDLGDTDFFLCGGAELIARLKRELYLKGAKLHRLRTDIFVPAAE
jgi:ferredoxin-NADP reductase/ferredoxin